MCLNMHFQQCFRTCYDPASSCELLKEADWSKGKRWPLHSAPPPPLRGGSQGGWGLTTEVLRGSAPQEAVPAAVLAALELPLGLTCHPDSLNVIAHC